MPSAVETRRRTRPGAGTNRRNGLALFVATLLAATATAADTPLRTPAADAHPTHFTPGQIAAAVDKVKADSNLGIEKKVRRLVKNSRPEPQTPNQLPDWLRWLTNAFAWLAGTARALVWMVGIVLAGILALYIKRFLEARGERSVPLRFSTPTHVRDLDIRPESLPDDIAGTANELWASGEHRAALALLYRALLSRLAHVHGIPILDSSTEGDCLALAQEHLPATRSAYVARLIRVWQRAVYGNTNPSDVEFHVLAEGFSGAMDERAPTNAAAVGQAA